MDIMYEFMKEVLFLLKIISEREDNYVFDIPTFERIHVNRICRFPWSN